MARRATRRRSMRFPAGCPGPRDQSNWALNAFNVSRRLSISLRSWATSDPELVESRAPLSDCFGQRAALSGQAAAPFPARPPKAGCSVIPCGQEVDPAAGQAPIQPIFQEFRQLPPDFRTWPTGRSGCGVPRRSDIFLSINTHSTAVSRGTRSYVGDNNSSYLGTRPTPPRLTSFFSSSTSRTDCTSRSSYTTTGSLFYFWLAGIGEGVEGQRVVIRGGQAPFDKAA